MTLKQEWQKRFNLIGGVVDELAAELDKHRTCECELNACPHVYEAIHMTEVGKTFEKHLYIGIMEGFEDGQ